MAHNHTHTPRATQHATPPSSDFFPFLPTCRPSHRPRTPIRPINAATTPGTLPQAAHDRDNRTLHQRPTIRAGTLSAANNADNSAKKS